MPFAPRIVLVCTLAALLASAAAAQAGRDAPAPLVLRGVPASDALAALAEAAGVDVVFSPALVGQRPVWCGGAGWQATDVLGCITAAVGLDYVRRSSGTYVVTERAVEEVRAGRVAGLVVDAATGEPLPLAHVRLATGTAVADAEGRFAVGPLAPGAHVLTASFVGYRPQGVRVTVAPGGVAQARIGLEPAVTSVGTVVVDGLVGRAASEGLGADAGFEIVRERAAGRATAALPDLAESAPAAAGALDGPALRPLLGIAERSFRSGLSIQGGEAGEHALTLDGATVYEPFTLGSALGALSPLAVGRVTVRKAGFGAAHGSQLAGLVEARHALERPEGGGALDVAAEADAYAAGAKLRGHARLGRLGGEPVEATALVAARRSLWELAPPGALGRALREWNAVDPVLAAVAGAEPVRGGFDAHRHGSDVQVSDVHAAARVRVGALRQVRASVYRGAAGVGTELFASADSLADPDALVLARDGTHWTNLVATLRADAVLGPRWRAGLGLRHSGHRVALRYDEVRGAAAGLTGAEPTAEAEARLAAALDARTPGSSGNALHETALTADAAVSVAAGHEVSGGLELALVRSRFHILGERVGAVALRDLDAAHGQARVAAFAEGRHRLGARWTLEPGLRLTALAASGDVVAEPRLALRFDARAGDRALGLPLAGVAARLAAGVYRQFASRVEMATFGPSALVPSVALWLPADGSLAPPTALHAAAEVLWQPSDAWAARVEGYAKALPRVYALDAAALVAGGPALARQAEFLRAERGRAAGVGVRLDRQARRWAATAGLGVARTDRRAEGRFGGRWTPAPWAEPLRATLGADVLVAGERSGAHVLARVRGLGVWGRAWAFRRAYYDLLPAAEAARGHLAALGRTFDDPAADRLPPRLLLDVGLAAAAPLPGGRRLELAADIENVLDRRDALDWSLAAQPDGTFAPTTRALPGLQPSLRVRVTL